ncbi:MAG: hypothetical protein IK017_08095 [Paludibacteraceae bacterium]|nr:hypothetical protein [Paludibacteraceae bacterium]
MDTGNKTYAIILQYLRIQILFVSRFCMDIGPFRIVFLLVLMAFLFMNLFFLPKFVPLMVYSLMIYVYNAKKKDREFLKIIVGKKYKICYFILYMIIALPFLLISALETNWCEMVLYPLSAVLIAFSPSLKKNVRLRFSHPLLTKDAYEYLSGFRLSSVLYVVLFVISVMGAFNGNVKISKVMSAVVVYILNLFYMIDYRSEYVLNYSHAKSIFILKIKNIVVNNAVCLLPFLVLILGFEHTIHSFYICVLMYVISVMTMINTLSFRILFEKTDVIEALLVTMFYAIAMLSLIYFAILPFCVVAAITLSFAANYKVKKITRI